MTNTDNVTLTDKAPHPSCHFSITATLQGFPIEISGEGRAGDLKVIIDRLLSIGAEPPTAARPEPTKAGGTPACPEHGKAKPSKKPGSFYCPTALPDGGYCTWTGKA
jgi:hypothetical protein